MKNLRRILFTAAASALFLSSCEDAYDIVQDGELNESAAFQSVDDIALFLNGVYGQASNTNAIGFTAVITDEAGIGSQSGGQNVDLYKYVLDNNDGFANGIWLGNYSLINYSNRLLRGAARVTPDPADEAYYNSMLAEARVLRAFGHLQLLTYFSTDMKDDNALGVILMDRVPATDEDLPRNTNGEVFALIESDLAFADTYLQDRAGVTAYKYVTKNMVNAMRARMYAYRGNYPLAEQYADQALAQRSISQAGTISGAANNFISSGVAAGLPAANNNFYLLTGSGPTNDYAKMWGDFAQGEVIFALSRPALAGQQQVGGLFYFNRTQLSGGPYHDMDYNLFKLLDDPLADGAGNDFDIRRVAFVDPTSVIPADPEAPGDFRTQSIPLIDKYRGKSGATGADLMNDLKIFRASEMLLIKVEARIAAGDLATAATLIKQLRDARIYTKVVTPANTTTTAPPRPLPVYANATQAWADLLKERRVELCFEAHRYIDLKRLGSLAGVTNDRFHRECETNNVGICALPNNDYRYTMPIPRPELNANANIQQNPNY